MGLFDLFRKKKQDSTSDDAYKTKSTIFDDEGMPEVQFNDTTNHSPKELAEPSDFTAGSHTLSGMKTTEAKPEPADGTPTQETTGSKAEAAEDEPRRTLRRLKLNYENEDVINDKSYIIMPAYSKQNGGHYIFTPTEEYDLKSMAELADYIIDADFTKFLYITVLRENAALETDLTDSFINAANKVANIPIDELKGKYFKIVGISRALDTELRIYMRLSKNIPTLNIPSKSRFDIYTEIEDDVLMMKYAETILRRTFGTDKEMKLANPKPLNPTPDPKPTEKKPEPKHIVVNYENEPLIDDVTYIKDAVHITAGFWQQYDFLLAAQGYGWDYMVSLADYIVSNDFEPNSMGTITVAELANMPEQELIEEFKKEKCGTLKEFTQLKYERGVLCVGGISKAVRAPAKIVLFNQTRILRIFSLNPDEQLMIKYAESLIRQNLNTDDAMKLAKPIPEQEK